MTSNSPRDPEEQGRGDPAATGGGNAENLQAPDGSANVVDGETATLAGVPEPRAGDTDGSEAAQWDVAAQGGKRDDPLLASLVTLIGRLDRPMSAEALIAGLPLPDSDLTPELFVRAAERAGLNAKLVKRRVKQISNLTLPCVLLLSPRSACVLVHIDKRDADIIFPESGDAVTRVPLTELAKQYLGYALFARPQVNLESHALDVGVRQSKAWFWGTLLRFWPIYASVAFAALLINLFALVTPLFIMNVYDRVVPNNAIETLWVLAIGVATVFVFDFILRILRSYFADAAGRSADTLIASRMFEQVMGMKMSARPQSAGAMASHLREFETLRDFFTSVTLTTLIDLPFVFLFIAMIWFVGGPLAYVPLIAVPIVLFVGLIIQIPLTRVVRRTFTESAHKHGILFEAIGGLETVKSMGAEGRMQRNWENEVGRSAKSAAQARSLSTVAISLAAFSQNFVTVGVVVFGVYQIAEGEMTVGALVAATILAGRTMAPLAQIAGLCTRFQQSRAALKALDQIMKMPVERPASRSFLHRPRLNGDIEFKKVVFAYPNQQTPVLDGLSFSIKAGERVGVIGRIGSGKSTIERLILGLYEPAEGSVLVDGTDVRQIDPADLRRNIGCIPQEVYLFSGSVRDNIAFSAPDAGDDAVMRAAKIAGVEDFVRLHPQGFDLQVGERGDAVSGGQRQAIALARALLTDRPILIFDEPTSAMDSGSESRFKSRLEEHLEGKTLVLITHRASLLSLVERLIVIDGGKVVADGPREVVLRRLSSKDIQAAKE